MEKLRTFELSTSTLKSYRYSAFGTINSYFVRHNRHIYSKRHTKRFIESVEVRLKNNEISARHYRKLRKAAALLDEYYTTGNLEWKGHNNHSKIRINKYFSSILFSYEADCTKRLASGTIKNLKATVLQFFKFLEDKGHKNFNHLSNKDIRDFILRISPNHRGSMGNVLFSLRILFKYLKESGISELKTEWVLQKPASPRKKIFPCFSHEEVKSILDQIDINTAKGKRDYAIIYLASHTGLRLSDILCLKLTDIDWTKNEIHLIQRKTGKPLLLPLDVNAGNAIANYILAGRPNTDSTYIFLRTIAPYTKLADGITGRNILKKYLSNARIIHLPGDGKSFHAFRRSMGTWMLEADIPLSIISQVLGHRDQNSVKQYLSLHYSALTECALSLQEIETEKEELL